MKTLVSFVAFALSSTILFGQNKVTLVLNHQYNNTKFEYNKQYSDEFGNNVQFSRLQYYLSGITLIHDGGQTTATDSYVLASGHMSNYELGTHSVTSIEGIKFDLGVDEVSNNKGTSSWDASHPLGPKSPKMDWGWPAGYFFIAVDGKGGSASFTQHAFGQHLLTNVDQIAVTGKQGADGLEIHLNVNIEGWYKGLDASKIGFQHNGSGDNQMLFSNTNSEKVFTASSETTGTGIQAQQDPSLFVDYSLTYAPTIYYSFTSGNHVDISITDLNGREMLASKNMAPEGNFFVRKELPTGIYVARFHNGQNVETIKFQVTR